MDAVHYARAGFELVDERAIGEQPRLVVATHGFGMKPTRTSKGEQGEGQSEDQRLDHDHAHGQEDGPFPGNPTLRLP